MLLCTSPEQYVAGAEVMRQVRLSGGPIGEDGTQLAFLSREDQFVLHGAEHRLGHIAPCTSPIQEGSFKQKRGSFKKKKIHKRSAVVELASSPDHPDHPDHQAMRWAAVAPGRH